MRKSIGYTGFYKYRIFQMVLYKVYVRYIGGILKGNSIGQSVVHSEGLSKRYFVRYSLSYRVFNKL